MFIHLLEIFAKKTAAITRTAMSKIKDWKYSSSNQNCDGLLQNIFFINFFLSICCSLRNWYALNIQVLFQLGVINFRTSTFYSSLQIFRVILYFNAYECSIWEVRCLKWKLQMFNPFMPSYLMQVEPINGNSTAQQRTLFRCSRQSF